MGWLRLDDAFGDHPKIAGLSDRAFRAHVLGLLYCAHQVSDGFVPTALAPKGRTLHELTTAGLWTATRRGFTIHDWLDWNPSRAEVDSKRHAKSIAGAKGAASRWHDRRNAPIPSPTPPKEQTPAPAKRTRPRDELFEALAEVEHADLDALTRSARGKLNNATKQLREVGATADDVRSRAAAYRRQHPTWDLTAPSLVKFWPSLNGAAPTDRYTPSRSVDDMTDEEIAELMDR